MSKSEVLSIAHCFICQDGGKCRQAETSPVCLSEKLIIRDGKVREQLEHLGSSPHESTTEDWGVNQTLYPCEVEGCIAELEVLDYPYNFSSTSTVERSAIETVGFFCIRNKGEDNV